MNVNLKIYGQEKVVYGQKEKIVSLLIVLALVCTLIPTNVEAASKVKINKTKATVYVGKL